MGHGADAEINQLLGRQGSTEAIDGVLPVETDLNADQISAQSEMEEILKHEPQHSSATSDGEGAHLSEISELGNVESDAASSSRHLSISVFVLIAVLIIAVSLLARPKRRPSQVRMP